MGNKEAIPELTKKLQSGNYFVRKTSTESLAFGSFKKEDICMVLPFLKGLLSTDLGRLAFDAARPIQVKCQFYDYEIWQQSIQSTKSENQKTEQAEAAKQSTNIFPNATEVRIFERVDRYYENPPSTQDPPA